MLSSGTDLKRSARQGCGIISNDEDIEEGLAALLVLDPRLVADCRGGRPCPAAAREPGYRRPCSYHRFADGIARKRGGDLAAHAAASSEMLTAESCIFASSRGLAGVRAVARQGRDADAHRARRSRRGRIDLQTLV